MKKIVLVCGLISGVLISIMMLYSVTMCYNKADFEGSMVIGYAAMILAFSLIFVGIKNYRDKYNQGVIKFGKALKIGLYITLVASTMYVIVWVIDYYFFVPDFMDKYCTHLVNQTKATGAGQLEIDKKMAEMARFKEMYKNPFFVVLFTYSEVLPVGLIISLISALILKRKARV